MQKGGESDKKEERKRKEKVNIEIREAETICAPVRSARVALLSYIVEGKCSSLSSYYFSYFPGDLIFSVEKFALFVCFFFFLKFRYFSIKFAIFR